MRFLPAGAAAGLLCALAACEEGKSPDATRGAPPEAAHGPIHFTDATGSSGIDFRITSGKTPSTQILEVKGGGLALFDLENDGDLDLFVPNGATLESPHEGPGARLFRNEGALRFSDATEASGLRFRRWGMGVAAGDVEGDGFDDLFVGCFGPDVLLRNRGDGTLTDATEAAGIAPDSEFTTAAVFGDIDVDGDLDLYLVNYVAFDPAKPPPRTTFLGQDVFAGPRDLPAEPDRLLENQGDGTFRDISAASGILAVPPSYGLGALILDLDGDGTPEIYVGNDSDVNNLFVRGADGRYTDQGALSGIGTSMDGTQQATMGIAVADVNGDLLPDLFTTNFMNDTNTLHENLGSLLFEDRGTVYALAQVSRPYLGWATRFADFDHDADEDVVVFNGHVYPAETTDPVGWMHAQVPLCFAREGSRFERLTADQAGAWLSEAHCDRSAVFGDLDQDGDVDMVVGELNGPLRVLENDGRKVGPWLMVALKDGLPGARNPRGLGARVVATAGDLRQVRWVTAAESYQAANPSAVHFGLPPGTTTVELEVTWPGGEVQRVAGVAVNRYHTVLRAAP